MDNKFSPVHLLLHPHRIAPTSLKLESWSPGAAFIPIVSTKGIIQRKKEKFVRKKQNFMHIKRFNILFKYGCQFRVGAIPRLLYSPLFIFFSLIIQIITWFITLFPLYAYKYKGASKFLLALREKGISTRRIFQY